MNTNASGIHWLTLGYTVCKAPVKVSTAYETQMQIDLYYRGNLSAN